MANNNGNGNGNDDKGTLGHGGGNNHLVTIYVNGTPYEVEKGLLSYERLLEVMSAAPLPENQRYSVLYSKGNSDKPTGTLIEGESVEVKKDMEFDVTPATRS